MRGYKICITFVCTGLSICITNQTKNSLDLNGAPMVHTKKCFITKQIKLCEGDKTLLKKLNSFFIFYYYYNTVQCIKGKDIQVGIFLFSTKTTMLLFFTKTLLSMFH